MRHRSAMMVAVWILAGWVFANGTAILPKVKVENFRTRQQDEAGNIRWSLYGESAVLAGERVTLTGMRVVMPEDEGGYEVTTPSCVFNREARTLSGNRDVRLKSRQAELTGTGFDLDLDSRRLRIRRNVRLIVHHGDVNVLGKALKTE